MKSTAQHSIVKPREVDQGLNPGPGPTLELVLLGLEAKYLDLWPPFGLLSVMHFPGPGLNSLICNMVVVPMSAGDAGELQVSTVQMLKALCTGQGLFFLVV